jgi:hypothetical protein
MIYFFLLITFSEPVILGMSPYPSALTSAPAIEKDDAFTFRFFCTTKNDFL